ncbi:MAG: mechanosensitive ion channel family protein [Patescibacteria group bacterium]
MNLELALRLLIPVVAAFGVNIVIERVVRVPKNLQSSRTTTYLSVLKSLLTVLVYVVAGYYVLTTLKINMTPLFASAGVLGLVIGLGLRSFIEDFFTGIFILTEDTIRVGDYVEIAGSEGVTESLGLRTVRLRDKNGAIHIFPNREIKKIINYSKRGARVIVDIPIKTNQPLESAEVALTAALTTLRKHKTMGQYVHENSRVEGVEAINPGSIVLRTLILTRATDRWNAARAFRKLALSELAKAKVLLS